MDVLEKMPSFASFSLAELDKYAKAHPENAESIAAAKYDRRKAVLLQSGITSSELLSKTFAPMPWLVQDLIPAEGLSILASKMGNGKSYFLLQLAAALSIGAPFLGRETKRRGVLLIALEDSERRIRTRLDQLGAIGTAKLLIYTHWAKGKQALEDLRILLIANPEIKVVLIDPIVKFIDLCDFDAYGGAYGSVGPIKDVLDVCGVTGIFSHHAKKAVSDIDALDDILGSTGWGAACDTRLVLRRQRGSDEGTLITSGRDVAYSESALTFAIDTGWTYQGKAADVRMSEERREILDLLEDAGGPLRAAEIARRLGKNEDTTRGLLRKMADTGHVLQGADRLWTVRKAITVVTDVTVSESKAVTPVIPVTDVSGGIAVTVERGGVS